MKNSQNISELNKVTQSKYQVEGLIFSSSLIAGAGERCGERE